MKQQTLCSTSVVEADSRDNTAVGHPATVCLQDVDVANRVLKLAFGPTGTLNKFDSSHAELSKVIQIAKKKGANKQRK
jgi:hypothetical protein